MGDVNLLRYALATQKVERSKVIIFFRTAQHMICSHFWSLHLHLPLHLRNKLFRGYFNSFSKVLMSPKPL